MSNEKVLHRTEIKLGRKASPEFLSVGDLSVKENEFVSFSFTDGVITRKKSRINQNNKKSARRYKQSKTKTPKKLTSVFGRGKRGKETIETKLLGKPTTGYLSKSIKITKDTELIKFINEEITNGPQIVSIPVPPYRHAFLVDVQPKKIMISDWGGEENKTLGIAEDDAYEPGWKQYSDLMIKLEKKYKRPIKYYPVDQELYKIAYDHNEKFGGGGCSYYIYAWVEKYYPNYNS